MNNQYLGDPDDFEIIIDDENNGATFDDNVFIEDILNNNYVLVVGNEGVLNTEIRNGQFKKYHGDMRQMMLRLINASEFKNPDRFEDFSQMSVEHNPCSLVKKYYLRGKFPTSFPKPTWEDLSPKLIELLRSRVFSMVFTTNFDDLIEQAMRKEWGDDLQVVDINDPNSTRDLQEHIISWIDGKKSAYETPTLFYIFGKAVDKETSNFVLTDNDAIKIMHRWMSNTTLQERFFEYISTKKIMAIGCNFDDWYMRFFWYMLKRDINHISQGQIIGGKVDDDHSKLKNYLEQNKIFYEVDADKFLDHILNLFSIENDNSTLIKFFKQHRKKGSIFLSYSSKNFHLATSLFMRLTNEGYNVWFDNVDLFGGDNYTTRISEAITGSQVFMPLLTQKSKQLMTDNADCLGVEDAFNKLPYVMREWLMASRHEKTFIPVMHDGFSPRDSVYTEVFEGKIVNHECTGIDLLQPDGFDKLTKTLDKVIGTQKNGSKA